MEDKIDPGLSDSQNIVFISWDDLGKEQKQAPSFCINVPRSLSAPCSSFAQALGSLDRWASVAGTGSQRDRAGVSECRAGRLL